MKTIPRVLICAASLLILFLAITSCRKPLEQGSVGRPIDEVELNDVVELSFWHRQTGRAAELQQQVMDEFMAANPKIKIHAEFVGDYSKLYQKTLAAIQAGSPPELVAAFETQAAEYYEAGALIPFDDYVASKRYGITSTELQDFVPSFLAGAKFPQYKQKMLTFRYSKSTLVLFTNIDLLNSLGVEKPASTWSEFLDHCRRALAAGKRCYPMTGDASTFAALVNSFGGRLISEDDKRAVLNDEATHNTLQLFETLGKEKLGYRVNGDDDVTEFVNGRALYMMKSSIMIRRVGPEFGDAKKWLVSNLPQGTSDVKPSVLFGANFVILKTSPEKQLAAWLFVKYFARTEATIRWGLDPMIGYFPLRESALSQANGTVGLATSPQFREAFRIARGARPEPSIRGWQQVRTAIEDAVTSVFVGKQTAQQAQTFLQDKATELLRQ